MPSLLLTLLVPAVASAETLEVGPGKPFATPCAAIAAAAAGDVIDVDAAGSYDGDVCTWSTDGLTIRGVGGRAKIDAAGNNSGGKGTFVVSGQDTTIENMELSGATVPDQNGAGIRHQGGNLTVRNCYFHDNENGILGGNDPASTILVEGSEFANNGFGDGYSHNMYIGHAGTFILRNSYSHHAKIGHLIKSRAAVNYILYNRVTDETGTASYELDLPNGGTSFVIGNLFQQSASTDNPLMLSYRAEGASPENPGDDLYVVNNTFVNDKGSGGFIRVQDGVATPALVQNNIFVGSGEPVNQAAALQKNNFSGDPAFIDAAAYDYHLADGSPCIDAGADPGMGGGESLVPQMQYVHPAAAEPRGAVAGIDIGAYEFGNDPASAGGAGGDGTSAGAGGGAPSGPSGAGGANGTPTGSGAASTSGPSGADAADGDADSGCSCRAAGSSPRSSGLAALAALAALGASLGRRRRRSRATLY